MSFLRNQGKMLNTRQKEDKENEIWDMGKNTVVNCLKDQGLPSYGTAL